MDPAGTRNCKVTWKSHSSEIANVLQKFRTENRFTDATILCSGITYAAHKVILASSSKYFKEVLSHADELHPCAHPIIVLNDIDKIMLETVLKFIYTGEVSVQEKDVGKLLDVANDLKIKGLSGDVLRTICLPKEVQGPITKDIECVENKSGETPRKRSLIDSTTVFGKTPYKRHKEAHERDFSDDNDTSGGIIVDDTVTTDPVIPSMQSIHKEEPSASVDREEEPSTCKDEALPQENKIHRNAGGRVLTGNADLDVQIKEEIIEDNYTPETIFLPCQAEAGGSGVKEETESLNNQGKSDPERLSESPSDCHNTSDEESKPLETSVGPVSSCSTARPTVTLDEKSAIPQELLHEIAINPDDIAVDPDAMAAYEEGMKAIEAMPYPQSVRPRIIDPPVRLVSKPGFPMHYLEHIGSKRERKRCRVCYKRNKRKDTFWQCAICRVALCSRGDCFDNYHSKEEYWISSLQHSPTYELSSYEQRYIRTDLRLCPKMFS